MKAMIRGPWSLLGFCAAFTIAVVAVIAVIDYFFLIGSVRDITITLPAQEKNVSSWIDERGQPQAATRVMKAEEEPQTITNHQYDSKGRHLRTVRWVESKKPVSGDSGEGK